MATLDGLKKLCEGCDGLFAMRGIVTGKKFFAFCEREIGHRTPAVSFERELRDIIACCGANGRGPRPWMNAAQAKYLEEYANEMADLSSISGARTQADFRRAVRDCGDYMIAVAFSLLAGTRGHDAVKAFLMEVSKDMTELLAKSS